jgi:hypothetical protein
MSDDRRPEGLDARLDATLRALVGTQEPADLRDRVMARVGEKAGERPSLLRPGPAALAAAVVVAFIGALVFRGQRAPEPPVRVVAEERRSPAAAPTVQAPEPSPSLAPAAPSPAPRVVAEAAHSVAERPRPRSRRARSARPVDPPEWRSTSLPGLAIGRIDIPAIAQPEPAVPADIAVGDLSLPPVELETSSPSTDQ